nr:winged helix DNA-binding domain-containing protein [Microlunatus panaciterrae]
MFDRVGPVQSQVPRAPFLAVASRLPGTTYATMTDLFARHRLVKTSNIRGTVHTSTRRQFGWLNAVAARTRANALRSNLRLSRLTVDEVAAQIERFCADDWRPRAEIVAHTLSWVADQEATPDIADLDAPGVHNLIWGHSGLIRRPRDAAWEKRTDIYHRTAAVILPDLQPVDADQAVTELVRLHLGAYGPATRRDLAFFLGEGSTRIDRALERLGDEVVRLSGPGTAPYLDLADPPTGGQVDPGLRLLPEFDGLLLGYHQSGRYRFIDEAHLPQIWAKANGLFSPVVLHEGRLVASWRTLTSGSRTDVEVQMFPGLRRLGEDLFSGPVAALEAILGLHVNDVRVG